MLPHEQEASTACARWSSDPEGHPAGLVAPAPVGRRPDTGEPDLLDDVADALATGGPVALLGLASTFVEVLTRRPAPFGPPAPEAPPVAEVVRSLVEVPCPETTALLAALAPMLPDELAARTARRELARAMATAAQCDSCTARYDSSCRAQGTGRHPKELRDELGIEPGDEVSFWRHDDHLALRLAGRGRPLRGRFRGASLVDELTRERSADRLRETAP